MTFLIMMVRERRKMKLKKGFAIVKIPLVLLWPFRIIVVAILIFGALGVAAYFQHDGAPTPAEAPWEIRTYSYDNGQQVLSRVFYGEKLLSIKGQPALGGFWAFDGKRYNYNNGVKVFENKIYGSVSIIARK